MPDAAHCPQCDTVLPADSVAGLCPECLLRLAMETETTGPDTLPLAGGPEAASEPAVERQFGAYRIVRLLGEGGMGTVYLAEQQEPIRRLVALKVIKLGMSTREVMARFDSERQALALMDHPHIARVFDAGASDWGRPYFVMEYVDGIPITEYCDRHRLNNRERIELFIAVCQAVHHAHQKGIIHRDIKPSNVLVAEQDGKPFPKVIDFGIAKAIDQRVIEQATFTQAGSLVGTPEYMSPEQTPLSSNIDTTTDVYSLGVLLYELLAGALPFEGKRLREAGLAELLRIIREEEPPTPSDKVSKLADTAEVADRRRTNPALLRRQLTGDLNWIVMKALEKERRRRYASVSELAADIRRHLENHPVLAGPPSKLYRARKFVQRHRLAVSAGMLIAASLITGAGVATWQAGVARAQRSRADAKAYEAERQTRQTEAQRQLAISQWQRAEGQTRLAEQRQQEATAERNRAVAEKQRADTEAATATAVNDFLRNDLLAQASANVQALPDTKPDPDLKVRTALDRAASRLSGKFATQPLVEAAIRQTIGKTYQDLGIYPDAQRHLARAVELRHQVLGEEHPATLTSMHDLALLFYLQAKYAQAEPLFTNVVKVRGRVLGPEHADTLDAMNDLALLYQDQGKLAQAEPLYAKILDVRRRVLGEEHPDRLISTANLALLYMHQGKYAQAEPLWTQVLEAQRRVLGGEHPTTLTSMNNLAAAFYFQGKYTRAEPLFAELLEVQRRVLGQEHPQVLMSMSNLAQLYRTEGKYAQAEPLFTKAVDAQRRVMGEEHPATLAGMSSLASLYEDQGRYSLAEPLSTKVLEVKSRVLGAEHPDTLISMNNLALLYQGEGKYAQAEPLSTKVLEVQRRVLGAEHPGTLISMNNLARLYGNEGKYAEAEPLYIQVVELQRRVLGAEHPNRLGSMNGLALLYVNQGKDVQAEALLREALNGYQKGTANTWDRYSCQSLLGASLAGQKKYAEAEPLAVSGYEGMLQRKDTIPAASRFKLEQAGAWIVQLYQDWGKPESAAVWTKKIQAAGLPVSPKKP